MVELQERVVMVTGAAQGLGEGIVRRLADEGVSVALADINGDKAKSVADSPAREGRHAIAVPLDVAERKQVRDAIATTVGRVGRLDVIFNNAGVVVAPLWGGLEQDTIDKGAIKQKGEFIESFSSSILLSFPSEPEDLAGVGQLSSPLKTPAA